MIVASTIEIDLSTVAGINEVVRMTDAPFDIKQGGVTYRSMGSLLKIDKASERNVLFNQKFVITLSGLDQSIMAIVNSANVRMKPLIVKRVQVADGNNEITSSSVYYRGFVDTPEMNIDYDSGSVTVGVSVSSMFDLTSKPDLMRANASTHEHFHAGDKFMQYSSSTGWEDEMWVIHGKG